MASKDNCQVWLSANRQGDLLEKVSRKIKKKIVSPLANGAITFKRVGDDLYLTSYYGNILKVTNDLAICGQLPIAYEDPTSDNEGIAYVRGIDFNGENLVALVSQARHLVRIYDRNLGGAPVAEIGEFNSVGNVRNNRLNEPRDCLFLEGGNLLVVNRFGLGATGTGSGHVSEYDPSGAFVASRLEFSADGESAIGKNIVRQPTKIRTDPNEAGFLWISEYGGRILKVAKDSWLVTDMIYSSNQHDLGSLESFCFLSSGFIAIASINFGGIVIVDPITKQVISTVDPTCVGATREVRDVVELEDGFLGVTTWSNRNLDRGAYVLPIDEFILLDYSNVELKGYEIARDLVPMFYDPEISVCRVPIKNLECVRDSLAIPFRKSFEV